MARPPGAVNSATKLFQRKVRDIISDDEYIAVIKSLIDTALNSRSPNAKVAAAKIIIERVEGNLPQAIISSAQESVVTVESILNDFRTKDTSE